MSDLFDSLKKNNKSAGKKRNIRELSPVKFPFSDDEDSDDVVLKKPTSTYKKNKSSPETERLLKLMKKCVVRLPKDKDGRLLSRIHAEWKRQRNNNKKNNKNNKFPIVKIKKSFTIPKTSSPKQALKTPESQKKPVKQQATPAKVYVKFPLSTPNSNRKKKVYAKTPNKIQKRKPRGYDIAVKRLNATPALVREFGKRFFMSFVDIQNSDLAVMLKNPRMSCSPPRKKKLNSSVRFNDTVEYFGASDSEEEEDDVIADIMPVSLVTALNGTSTPSPTPKGRPSKITSLEKKKPILTPAAKKNYRLSDEKKANSAIDLDEDDDAEYIVPTEISPSPPKKQTTSPSPEKEKALMLPVSEPSEVITDSVEDAESQILNSVDKNDEHKDDDDDDNDDENKEEDENKDYDENKDESIHEETPQESEQPTEEVDEAMEESTPAAVETSLEEEEPKNNSHNNDFENDEDSQGQNIVQDFISRTVQDLSHDDSEDIQDDEELVDEKQNSPSENFDNDSTSNKFSKFCQVIKEKILGSTENDQEMENDNA